MTFAVLVNAAAKPPARDTSAVTARRDGKLVVKAARRLLARTQREPMEPIIREFAAIVGKDGDV